MGSEDPPGPDKLASRLEGLTPLQRAVFALKEAQARLAALERRQEEPIAIVGMACRFPGGADDPEAYWRLLRDGVDAIRVTPADRWDAEAFYDPDPAAPGKMNTRWGGFLDGIDRFDNRFFGISDAEAAYIDPQQRFLLELAWEALEDAGLPPAALRGSRTGVFVGISLSHYGILLARTVEQCSAYAATGSPLCLAANRISYAFGWEGPSLALDTACSSSLVATHLACQSLRRGESELALVGGTSLLLSPLGTVNLTKAGFSSRDGRVRAFDEAASGYVRGEGTGVVVLKPLAAARRDRDPIHAVIRGSAVNQNGISNGLTAPARAAQEKVVREALRDARVSPAQLRYVEAQGTGTRLGDAIEALALGSVLGEGRPPGDRCAIGSAKTNIGHLEAAAGLASLIKTALALEHRQLPPSLHFKDPSPDIPFAKLPLRVQASLEPWPASPEPRLAGVSAFGFGGSNAHVVLEEAPPVVVAAPAGGQPGAAYLLPLSARTDKALRELAARYLALLRGHAPGWADLCHTASRRRDHHDCRLAVVAATPAAAADLLEGFLAGRPAGPVFAGRKPYGRDLKVAFRFDGAPARWRPLLGRLAGGLPGFSSVLAEAKAAPGVDPARAGPTLLATLMALATWWRKLGVVPAAVVGDGVGELAAAWAAGILPAEAALALEQAAEAGGPAPGTIAPRRAALPFLSSLDGREHRGDDLGPAHWARCRDDAGGLAAALASLGARQVDLCLELGPGSAPGERAGPPVVAALRVDAAGEPGALEAAAALYAAGAGLAFEHLAPAGLPVRLPTYPWQHQRLWIAAAPEAPGQAPAPVPAAADGAGGARPRPDLNSPFVPPGTEVEARLAASWREVLGLATVGIHDNFFALGGNSLLAAQVVSRATRDLGVELPMREVFQAPTIAELAALVAGLGPAGKPLAAAPIPAIPRDGPLLPSINQEALWFLDQLDRQQPTYTLYPVFRIGGELDAAVLERALNEIARRHETLRTTFPEVDGRPVQVIAPPGPRELARTDLGGLAGPERALALRELVREEMLRPVDLQRGPIIRARLVRLGPAEHVLVAAAHHIVYDGWSMALMARELTSLYQAFRRGLPSPLPDLPIQYADYAAWQRRTLDGGGLDRLGEYWARQLADLPPLELPADFPRPALRTTRGNTVACDLGPGLSEGVRAFGRREGLTPFMALLAAFQVLLQRYSGATDFAIGTPVANRTRPETELLVGYFINMVVLRADLAGDPSFRELVDRVRRTALGAFENAALTLDRVVDRVRPARDPSRHPLFQVMFVLQNNAPATLDALGLAVEPVTDVPAPRSAFFELTLTFEETPAGFRGFLNFNTDLFADETAARMAGHYRTLLAGLVAAPDRPVSEAAMADAGEAARLSELAAGPRVEYPVDACIHELFEAQAGRTPEALALVDGERRLSYRELDRRAERLAGALRAAGVVPDQVVAVRLGRSADLIVALLAVLKAGGAYLPLDPELPPARLELALRDAGAAVVVTDPGLARSLPPGDRRVVMAGADPGGEGDPRAPAPRPRAGSRSLAYVMYTSGSTGEPKGVMIEHRALVNYACAAADEYAITSADRVLQFASVSFDAHVEEVFPCLVRGAALVLRTEAMLDSREFLRAAARQGLTFITLPTAFWHELVSAMEQEGLELPASLRMMVIGGEQARPERAAAWLDGIGGGVRLLNTYGPTEATVVVTSGEPGRADCRGGRLPIGRPLPNTRAMVLDGRLRPVPVGVPGELYLGGDCLARGYLGRPDLTAERFLPDPAAATPGARMYRTGDVARWLPDGRLELLGRTDEQVKIRGYRIEPGEVEQVLGEHPLLAQVAVVAREPTPGDPRLVAYFAAREAGPVPIPALRRYLAARLPAFMVPTAFVRLDVLPRTSGGKVDRRALPAPVWGEAAAGPPHVAPRTGLEKELAGLWAEALQVERVGLDDHFFEQGGNSLLGLRLVSRIRTAFAVDLPLATLFLAPQLRELAARVEALRREAAALEEPIRPRPRGTPAPLAITQERYLAAHRAFANPSLVNQHVTIPLQGEFDVAALRTAVDTLVARHEVLRTAIVPGGDGVPRQEVLPALAIPLPVEDLSHLGERKLRELVPELARRQASEVFDLARAPLFRVRLLKVARNYHVILATTHHIVSDGWSLQVLAHELAHLYDAVSSGRPPVLPPLPIQYGDFAAWQRERMQGACLAHHLCYWREKLAGLAPQVLPTDRPAEGTLGTPHALVPFQIPAAATARLEALARAEGATMAQLVLGAYMLLLHRWGGSRDVAVLTNLANRRRPETQGLLGCFTNWAILRHRFGEDDAASGFLAQVARNYREALEHEDLPIEFVLRDLVPGHDLVDLTLVPTVANFHQRAIAEPMLRNRRIDLSLAPAGAKEKVGRVQITLDLSEVEHGLSGYFDYREALFDRATIERLAKQYQALLAALAADPGQAVSRLPVAMR